MDQNPGETRGQFYERYMRSNEWRATRQRYFKSGMPQGCQGCGTDPRGPAARSQVAHNRQYGRPLP